MSTTPTIEMSDNKPYFLRAIYDWISANHCMPYLCFMTTYPGVEIPPHLKHTSPLILNISMTAVSDLVLGNEWISFNARFNQQAFFIRIPVASVMALYAVENGQGVTFAVKLPSADVPASEPTPTVEPEPTTPTDQAPSKTKRPSFLKIIK